MTNTRNKPNVWFWIIGVIALIWNLLGVDGFRGQAMMSERFKTMYTEEQLEVFSNLPSWYIVIFGIAVITSALACIMMLLKKKIAVGLFQLGLLAVLIQTTYNLFVNEGRYAYGPFEYSMLVLIPVVAVLLLLYSKNALKKDWLS
ncbi:MAG: hypothetical protein PSN34_11495 [Urechidicola sp.]|nr:hypothetical protein [Urechidicola sp.]